MVVFKNIVITLSVFGTVLDRNHLVKLAKLSALDFAKSHVEVSVLSNWSKVQHRSMEKLQMSVIEVSFLDEDSNVLCEQNFEQAFRNHISCRGLTGEAKVFSRVRGVPEAYSAKVMPVRR